MTGNLYFKREADGKLTLFTENPYSEGNFCTLYRTETISDLVQYVKRNFASKAENFIKMFEEV